MLWPVNLRVMDRAKLLNATLYLVPIAGPPLEPLTIADREGGVRIGRHAQCDVSLPLSAESVSRFHCRFDFEDGEWRLTDLNSRWGTMLNGVRMSDTGAMPLAEGDLVRIAPWTFAVRSSLVAGGMDSVSDERGTVVQTFVSGGNSVPSQDMVSLLLESAAAIHGASSEKELAECVMDAAIRGTGLPNAIMLRPLNSAGRIEPIAMRVKTEPEGGFRFSRSLIAAAAEGRVARLGGSFGGSSDISQSIVEMKISAALCVPLMLGDSPAALLYLDARGPIPAVVREDATEVCVALGRMASLAMSNLKRVEIERRSGEIESELHAAAAAQKWVMPGRSTVVGSFCCLGESRAGQFVGGDFFDAIDLGEGRLGVALGDVSGKGVSASVLMTATQGFLNASLSDHADAGRAVTAVNRYVCPRRPESRFVTLWLGVFDFDKQTVTYVDAGHGYALKQSVDGSFIHLAGGNGPPLGVSDSHRYQSVTVPIAPGEKVIVVSDGIVEQFSARYLTDGKREEFGVDGIKACLSKPATSSDDIQRLFDAVFRHAGGSQLADDATAVLVTLGS